MNTSSISLKIQHILARVDTQFIGRILLLIVGYELLARLFWGTKLSESAYFEPVLLVQLFQDPSFIVLSVLTIFILAIEFIRNRRTTTDSSILSWAQMTDATQSRYLLGIVALTFCWAFAFNEYNFYYDQPHLIDRLIILALSLLVFWKPIFVVPFTAYCMMYISQYEYPTTFFYSWTDKRLVMQSLILFSVFILLRPILSLKFRHYLFVLLVMIASFYVFPAIGKINLGTFPFQWIFENNLGHLVASAYANGWLNNLTEDQLTSIIQFTSDFRVLLQIITIIIELVPFALIVNRRLMIGIILSLISLHIGIFISSGIFFWKWIILDLSLIGLLISIRHKDWLQSWFQPKYIIVFVVLILGAPQYFSPHVLAWFDTEVNNFYEFQAVDADGNIFDLERGFFAPYDIVFAQSRFHKINPYPVLVGAYGAQGDFAIFDMLRVITNNQDVKNSITENGKVNFQETQFAKFEAFLTQFLQNYNQQLERRVLVSPIYPPHHILSYDGKEPAETNIKRPIAEIRVRYIETWLNRETLEIVTDEIIHTIPITNGE